MENQELKATQPIAPEQKLSATPQPPVAQLPHDSNPFTTTLKGVKKLFKFNTGPLIGVLLFSLFLSFLSLLSLAAVAVSFVALMVQNSPESSIFLLQFGQDTLNFYSSFAHPTIITSFILGPILLIGFMALGQAIQLKLFTASSESQHIGFGDVFKQSLRRTLPFIGLTALMIVATVLIAVIIGLLSQVLGFLTVVLGIIAFFAAIYFSLRISLAMFSVIDENLGPIASLKRSWALTKGHFGEMLGISAATLTLALLPVIVFDALALAFQSTPVLGVIFMILAVVISFIVGSIALVGFSERFVQLRAIADGRATATKTHPANYIALVLVVVLGFIAGLVSPKETADPFGQPSSDQELQQYLEDFQESEGELPSSPLTPDESLPESESEIIYPEDTYNVN